MSPEFEYHKIFCLLDKQMDWSLFQSEEWNNILSQNVEIFAKYRYRTFERSRTDDYTTKLKMDVLNHKKSISAYLMKLNTFVSNIPK